MNAETPRRGGTQGTDHVKEDSVSVTLAVFDLFPSPRLGVSAFIPSSLLGVLAFICTLRSHPQPGLPWPADRTAPRPAALAQHRLRQKQIAHVVDLHRLPISVTIARRSSPKNACGSDGVVSPRSIARPRHRHHRAVVQIQRLQILPPVHAAGLPAASRDRRPAGHPRRVPLADRAEDCGPSRSRVCLQQFIARCDHARRPHRHVAVKHHQRIGAERRPPPPPRPSRAASRPARSRRPSPAAPAARSRKTPPPRPSPECPGSRSTRRPAPGPSAAARNQTCIRSPAARAGAADACPAAPAPGAGEDDA